MITHPIRLSRNHNLEKFDCGKHRLNHWLKKHALNNQEIGSSYTFVIEDNQRVIGYYAFSIGSIDYSQVPTKISAPMPEHYEIPVFLIARLAIDKDYQGKQLGKRLTRHALKQALRLLELAPLRAIVVDALDQEAKTFYSKNFDFEPWPIDALRLWLPIQHVIASNKE